MKIKKENGISVINIILLIFIIVAGVIIYIFITSNNNSNLSSATNDVTVYNTQSPVSENRTGNESKYNTTLTNSVLSSNTEPEIDYNRYYYKQLDSTTKDIYNSIVNNISAFKNGYDKILVTKSNEDLDLKFQTCWDAFSLDRPDVFYVDTNKISLMTQTSKSLMGATYEYSIQPQQGDNYFIKTWNNKLEVASAISQVENATTSIADKTAVLSENYNKIKFVHDYLVDNIVYDKTNDPNNSDIYGALVKGVAVCEGYANAFKHVMDKIGIPCVVVCGEGITDDGDSESHAWNYVMMDDGNWYAVDVTWDDPIIIGSGTIPDSVKYRYFLVGTENFSSAHREDGDVSGTGQNFKYPTLSASDYR